MNCSNHPNIPATWTDFKPDATKRGINLNESGYTRKGYCDECAALILRDCGNTSRLQRICQNDPNDAQYEFNNGNEQLFLCDVCLKETLFDMVNSNETCAFRNERWNAIQFERGISAVITVE